MWSCDYFVSVVMLKNLNLRGAVRTILPACTLFAQDFGVIPKTQPPFEMKFSHVNFIVDTYIYIGLKQLNGSKKSKIYTSVKNGTGTHTLHARHQLQVHQTA